MTSLSKLIINIFVLLAICGIIYLANPLVKTYIDAKYAEWRRERLNERLEQLQRDGYVIIVKPLQI